jgi:undecaprenyl phosphate-alpha-L-ara4FN deformylase
MKLGLRIEVSTLRALVIGVPRLVEMLKEHQAGATFLFALGAEHTGRFATRLLSHRIEGRVRPLQSIRRYGLRAMLSGTLLRGTRFAGKHAGAMRLAQQEGFETGVLAADHAAWRKQGALKNAAWTGQQMASARSDFDAVFGQPPRVHGAAGWQVNLDSLRLTQRLGYEYASDTRGKSPFLPVWRAEIVACPQLPVTLPTLEELNAQMPLDAAAERLLELTREPPPNGHLYAARADLEGAAFATQFDTLLSRWRGQGYELLSLKDYAESLADRDLPRHEIEFGELAPGFGTVAMQGREFLA